MKALKLEVIFGAKNGLSPALKIIVGSSNAASKALKKTKDEIKETLIDGLRAIYADIPASIWTLEDRNTLNVHERSTTKTPVP